MGDFCTFLLCFDRENFFYCSMYIYNFIWYPRDLFAFSARTTVTSSRYTFPSYCISFKDGLHCCSLKKETLCIAPFKSSDGKNNQSHSNKCKTIRNHGFFPLILMLHVWEHEEQTFYNRILLFISICPDPEISVYSYVHIDLLYMQEASFIPGDPYERGVLLWCMDYLSPLTWETTIQAAKELQAKPGWLFFTFHC